MKKYIFASILMFSISSFAFEVTGESFTAKWSIDSVTVGKLESTINMSSADTGQYGKVYLSYTLEKNSSSQDSFQLGFQKISSIWT